MKRVASIAERDMIVLDLKGLLAQLNGPKYSEIVRQNRIILRLNDAHRKF